jgi:HNH endonuclease
MSNTYIPLALRRLVEDRAQNRCEYCLLPAKVAFFPHEIDHIIAEKHGGQTDAENLAYACWRCNRRKGSDLRSFDPETQDFCFLFNPRTEEWVEKFRLEGVTIIGVTAVGRTTVSLLQLNSPERLTERQKLISLFP